MIVHRVNRAGDEAELILSVLRPLPLSSIFGPAVGSITVSLEPPDGRGQ